VLLTTCCAVVLASCGNGFGPDDVAGVYSLVWVNGRGLPNLVAIQGDSVAIFSGWMNLREDLTCSTGLEVLGGSLVGYCTYTLARQDITIENDMGQTLSGRTDGVTLLLTDTNGDEWVFRD
jgi:hypothetical protein